MDVELKDTLNKAWKEDKTTFGFRMMQKMGWKEDKGLGKNESGIVDNVKIQKREIGLGLGMEEGKEGNNKGWSETATSFSSVLEVLKAAYSKEKSKKKSKVAKTAAVPTISVGMKYKRHKEAKDMSTKSLAERKAIFGSSLTNTNENTAVSAQDTPADVFSSIKQSVGEEKTEKKGKSKKSKKEMK